MVKLTTRANGILFDTTLLPGNGTSFAKYMFRPSKYPSIETVALWDDKIVGSSSNGTDFNITLNGANQSYPINNINNTTYTNLTDLYFAFIDSLT
jgi:hypothetical protein